MNTKPKPKVYHLTQNSIFGDITVLFFLLGMIYWLLAQQLIVGALMNEFGESLEGVHLEVNVDLNETVLLEGMKENLNDFIIKLNETKYEK